MKDKTSFCLTGRRTYLDLVARPFLPEDKKFNFYFYDINAKVNHKFSDRSRLFLSFYKGKDHYDYKQDKEYDAYSNGSRMYFYNSRIDFNWETRLPPDGGIMSSTANYSAMTTLSSHADRYGGHLPERYHRGG
ncbi:MAG: hypothetical protein ACLRS8_15180 [Parabacteroides merdae]